MSVTKCLSAGLQYAKHVAGENRVERENENENVPLRLPPEEREKIQLSTNEHARAARSFEKTETAEADKRIHDWLLVRDELGKIPLMNMLQTGDRRAIELLLRDGLGWNQWVLSE